MQRADVGVDQLDLALQGHIRKKAVSAEAGVVDQHVDVFFLQMLIEVVGVLLAREVDRDNAHMHVAQLVSQLIELVGAARRHNEVPAARRQQTGKLSADAGACPRD